MFDILIRNGQVIDGSGKNPYQADIGITSGVIADIGQLSDAESPVVIDAADQYVCPGFIDVHSHSDAYLLIEPSAPSKIFQGVTTEVVGNCGASCAPLTGAYKMPSDWRDKMYPGRWSSVAEYRTLLMQVKPAVNVVMLAGHNTIRAGIAGYENRPLTEDELKLVCRLLERALDEGARGLSTGLIYSPGMFSVKEEIVTLARIVAKYDGIYTSHMRSEGAKLLEAIEETISIGRESKARVEISHLKTSGKANWNLADKAIQMINQAIIEGVEVRADRYPYTASCTDLDVIFPQWAAEGGPEAVLGRLRDPEIREKIRKELTESRSPDYWSNVTIGSSPHPDNHQYQGRPLMEAAQSLGLSPVDAALHFIETDELRTSAFFFGMSEENMMKILSQPFVMIGSDASIRSPEGSLSFDYPHPRAYGSFVKVIRMALDKKLLTLPEVIKKMTYIPARHFKLDWRGLIAKGMIADIAVFDPVRLEDRSTYAQPHQLAKGITHVLVNGSVTVLNGKLTSRRTGIFL